MYFVSTATLTFIGKLSVRVAFPFQMSESEGSKGISQFKDWIFSSSELISETSAATTGSALSVTGPSLTPALLTGSDVTGIVVVIVAAGPKVVAGSADVTGEAATAALLTVAASSVDADPALAMSLDTNIKGTWVDGCADSTIIADPRSLPLIVIAVGGDVEPAAFAKHKT